MVRMVLLMVVIVATVVMMVLQSDSVLINFVPFAAPVRLILIFLDFVPFIVAAGVVGGWAITPTATTTTAISRNWWHATVHHIHAVEQSTMRVVVDAISVDAKIRLQRF